MGGEVAYHKASRAGVWAIYDLDRRFFGLSNLKSCSFPRVVQQKWLQKIPGGLLRMKFQRRDIQSFWDMSGVFMVFAKKYVCFAFLWTEAASLRLC